MNKNPVFFEPTGNRWRWILVLVTLLGVLSVALLVNFSLSLLNPNEQQNSIQLKSSRKHVQVIKPNGADYARENNLFKTPVLVGPSDGKTNANTAAVSRPLAVGFYVDWDDSSFSSLSANVQNLDWVIPEWLHLTPGASKVQGSVNQQVLDLCRSKGKGVKILPLLNNFSQEKWQPDLVSAWVSTPERRLDLVAQLLAFVQVSTALMALPLVLKASARRIKKICGC